MRYILWLSTNILSILRKFLVDLDYGASSLKTFKLAHSNSWQKDRRTHESTQSRKYLIKSKTASTLCQNISLLISKLIGLKQLIEYPQLNGLKLSTLSLLWARHNKISHKSSGPMILAGRQSYLIIIHESKEEKTFYFF